MKTKYLSTKLACYVGYIVQAVVNNFLPILFIALQDVYGLGYEKLARLILFNFASQMLVDLVTPKILGIVGYRVCAVLSQATAAIGLLLLGILPNLMSDAYLAIILSIIVYAIGSGLMEVIISPMIEMIPSDNKSGNMAFLHSFYCWGQAFTIIVTTLLIFAFGYKNWANIPIIWAIIPFLNTFSFFKAPIIEPDREERTGSFKKLFKTSRFKIYMLMMFCAGASEIAMAEWASMFAQQALGVSKVIGDLAGPCAFALFMGTGRVLYGAVAKRTDFKKTQIIMSLMCFVCYIIVAFCNIPFIALVFCALCGFTVSLSWPGVYSEGAKDFKDGGSVMYSVFAMCGDTGCCFGPWFVGIIADKLGLSIGFGLASVFPILMILATVLLGKNKDCKTV